MRHLVRRLCISALSLLCAASIATSASTQQVPTIDASLKILDANQQPIQGDFFVLRDSSGIVVSSTLGPDGSYTLRNVGRKLFIELTPKGFKQHSFELLLEDAPKVFITMMVDPYTGHVKSITQKPHWPLSQTGGKVRKPGSGQIGLVVPPVNDACATPLPILAGVTAWTTVDATTDGPANCLGQINRDIWYDYLATATGTLTVSTCNQSTLDTKLAIYTGLTCPPGLPIGCNDDFGGCASFTSIASAPVVSGTHYLIRLGAFGATSTGTGTVTLTAPVGPPSFDQCATATDVGCNSSTVFSNAAATTSGTDPAFSCRFGGAGQGFGTSWFTFTAIGTSATIDTEGSLTGDTMLGVYSGTCGALVEIGCDDDSGTGLLSSVMVAGLTVSQVYYVQVAGFGAGNVGTNTLNVTCLVGPVAGDDCEDPIEVSCGSSTTVDLADLSTDPTDPDYSCRFGGAGQGVGTAWFKFVATNTSARVHTNDSPSATDTMLALYDGTCGAFTELCCSDDDGVGLLSEFCCEGLTIGNTYYIQVSSFDAFSLGDATLTIECPCPAPPANDACEDNEVLAVPGSVTFDNTLATDDIAVPCGVFAGPFKNVWYCVAGTGNTLTATTCNLGTVVSDTIISVFCKDCGDLVCVAGNDDNCPGGGPIFASTVSWCSQLGANYLITVGNFSAGTTPGVIQLDVFDTGSSCSPTVVCLPQGACCLPSGACVIATSDDCTSLDGTYQGDGTDCNSNAITDGSFEAGAFGGPWNESSTNFGTPLCDAGCGFGGGTGPNTGSWWSWFGGILAFEEGAVDQTVVIPVGATTLDFFLEIPVSSGNGVDFLEVNIDGNQEYLVLESAGPFVGYTLQQVPIAAYADGGAHSIEFHSIITGNVVAGSAFTNFFVDDVALNTLVIDCPKPPGACCLADGSCVEVTEEDCAMLSGMYNGDFSLCVDVSCPQPCHTLSLDDGGFSHGDSAEGIVGPGALSNVEGISNNGSNCNPGTSGTALVFNSDVGPFNQDPDLQVFCGNILILQTNEPAANPNDDEDGGSLTFSFSGGVEPIRVDLIDVDGGTDDDVTVTLIDGSGGDARVYTVPVNWTGDVSSAPGKGTLFLNVTTPQAGPFMGFATAVSAPGYDPTDVISIVISRGGCGSSSAGGSGGVDNLEWCE